MQERRTLFGKVERYLEKTAEELLEQARNHEGVANLVNRAGAEVHHEIAQVVKPLRKVEEKLRGTKK